MQNFAVNLDQKTYWISRSCAASGYVFHYNGEKLYVLACKRGSGAPDYQGYWNVPGGYLDFDETLKECCAREIAEETNLTVNPNLLSLYMFCDDPISSNHQNISFHYWTFSEDFYFGQTIYAKGAEENEIEDVCWIPIDELDNYEFAFNQKNIIRSIVLDNLRGYIPKELRKKFSKMKSYDNEV